MRPALPRPLPAVLVTAAVLLLAGCGGSDDPASPVSYNCHEIAGGGDVCASDQGPWVVRTQEEYDALLAVCGPGFDPPAPEPDQILVVVSEVGAWCTNCLGVACIRRTCCEMIVVTEGSTDADCPDPQAPAAGGWALFWDVSKPVVFEHRETPCP
jgi:hypothetical protein